ncbi:hypothetical protein [Pseudomonas sp. zfem003]|uniref:hypothetical protein n=1 Tax=Pseudomonas sp. zfem003 TaxID=3078198 RepID=UPI00292985DC|nr:hypothetical protein [Pseudomonas sp. zfem003]MDU9399010.1 hypothetical protein [Pseudomonas sp. zfem003]
MRQVTELDFRMPEFRNAKVEDYEFRQDGKLVRKDRWERGIHTIRAIIGHGGREFEIDDVVEQVRDVMGDWMRAVPEDWDEMVESKHVDLMLADGSILIECKADGDAFEWNFGVGFSPEDIGETVERWRRSRPNKNAEEGE